MKEFYFQSFILERLVIVDIYFDSVSDVGKTGKDSEISMELFGVFESELPPASPSALRYVSNSITDSLNRTS